MVLKVLNWMSLYLILKSSHQGTHGILRCLQRPDVKHNYQLSNLNNI